MRGFVLYLHFLVASLLVFVSHILVIFVIPDLLKTGIYYELFPILPVLAGFGVSYLYFRIFRVERPAMRAVISTITGTVLFLGSCLALVCSIAPALRNM
ncbi:MAG: hypothetical protein Q9N26_06185 [Aquificota bacterium]|nr:hypothetical protein [Aquificota bacterium]